jgi:hypothetical protein
VGAIVGGAAAIVPPHAIAAVQAGLKRRLHLDGSTLQPRTCQWNTNSAHTRALFPENAKVCTARKGPDAHGIDIDGVPMGSAAFKAARHEETLGAAAAVIAGIDKALISHGTGHIHRQAAFAMPRVCVYPRICHLLRCAHPSDVHGQHAKRFDEMLLNALARAVGIAGGGAIEDDGSTGIVRDRMSLSVAMGGWGMRQWADLAPVAFLAGAAAALPCSFIDRRITKHAGKENGAGKGGSRGSGSSQAKYELRRQQQTAP